MKKRRIIIILGPTASGKSALGVKLAKRFHGVVLSADSRQVYRGLDIGTAKITKREMQGVPHYLLDIVSPKRQFTVTQFQRAAQRVLKRIPTTTPVFVVGGSPFYVEAITNPRAFPNVKPNPKLRRQLEQRTAGQLFSQLRRRDPRRAAAIDPKNKRRLIRALEIVQTLGRVPIQTPASTHPVLKLGLNPARKKLYRSIDRRLMQRMPGILAEVKRLYRQGLSWKRMEQLGLEYRWGSRMARGLVNQTTGIKRLKGHIHAFARRQLTWWRRDRGIRWIPNQRSAERSVKRFLAAS
ncbi:MAG: tRNA (adenosine(37)-N6)-dimethylallyltransferase MiaA [Candidatus Kerfeldbacteria bacterium]|nr:tRNA (adenosine(37)-N6)-dimethylallyltransferase MiaA [Candidatus Kerfeldbacteria bacterium]